MLPENDMFMHALITMEMLNAFIISNGNQKLHFMCWSEEKYSV